MRLKLHSWSCDVWWPWRWTSAFTRDGMLKALLKWIKKHHFWVITRDHAFYVWYEMESIRNSETYIYIYIFVCTVKIKSSIYNRIRTFYRSLVVPCWQHQKPARFLNRLCAQRTARPIPQGPRLEPLSPWGRKELRRTQHLHWEVALQSPRFLLDKEGCSLCRLDIKARSFEQVRHSMCNLDMDWAQSSVISCRQ